jgi:ribosomal protein S20
MANIKSASSAFAPARSAAPQRGGPLLRRSAVKSARTALEGGQATQARETLQRTIQTLDKAVTKASSTEHGARKKSRLTRQLNALASR